MNISKNNPDTIRDAFRFLVDEFGYSITRDEVMRHGDRPYAFVIEYIGNQRRLQLIHDYQERFFYFSIIRGLNTLYPNDNDNVNIITFWKLFKSFDPSLELKELQPNDQTCAEAASANALLLKKYASRILKGEEWI